MGEEKELNFRRKGLRKIRTAVTFTNIMTCTNRHQTTNVNELVYELQLYTENQGFKSMRIFVLNT